MTVLVLLGAKFAGCNELCGTILTVDGATVVVVVVVVVVVGGLVGSCLCVELNCTGGTGRTEAV